MNASHLSSGQCDLGPVMGTIRCTSERLQIALCIVAVVAFVVLYKSYGTGFSVGWGIVGMAVFLTGAALAFKYLPFFSTRFVIGERGLEVSVNGKSVRIPYDQVSEFSERHTHRFMRLGGGNAYVGSRAEFEILVDGCQRPIKCNCEYHREKSTAKTIELAREKLSASVELKLARLIEGTGEVAIGPSVFLSFDGLRIEDPKFQTSRLVPFEDIETWRKSDTDMLLYKNGDGMPFLALPLDFTNFIPGFALLTKIHHQCGQDNHATVGKC